MGTKLTLYLILLSTVWHCVPGDECEDGYRETAAQLCGPWAKANFCVTRKAIMQIICRKTCRFCIGPYWSDWSNWGACSVSCATGVRTRSRVCISADPSKISWCRKLDGSMSPVESESQSCNTQKCPDCKDIELETGCRSWADIGFCEQHASEMQKWCAKSCHYCKEQLIGHWDLWSSWSPCPVSCGGSVKMRSRVCISPVIGEIAVCLTRKGVQATFGVQKTKCNIQECDGCRLKNRHTDEQMCKSWKQAGYCSKKDTEMKYWCSKTCGCDR